jgi:Icc-related predicted phosphoesterase
MKLLAITDLHGDAAMLSRILEDAGSVDVVLLGGDITHFGTPNAAEALVRRVRAACPCVLAVAGNCDSATIDRRLEELGVSLFRRGVRCGGVGFYGVSAMPPWTGSMYEVTEDEIGAALRTGRNQVSQAKSEVVLSHPPPRDTPLDLTRTGAHVGSTAVRWFIEEAQPALVVCGHIHEARGIATLGATTVVNCGAAHHGLFAVAEMVPELRVELRSVLLRQK